MKVLMFSTDPSTLYYQSHVYHRMAEYAKLLGELHIVAPGTEYGMGGNDNLFLHPTGRSRIRGFLRFYRIAGDLLDHGKFDVISVQGPDEVGLIGYILARRSRIPFQLQIHTDIMSPWYRRAGLKERIRYYIAKFLIPRADCIRVVSERIKKSLIKEFGIPHPFPPPSKEGGGDFLPSSAEGGRLGWGIPLYFSVTSPTKKSPII